MKIFTKQSCKLHTVLINITIVTIKLKCLQYTKLLHTTTFINDFIFNLLRNDDRVMPINRGACNLCDSAEQ